MVNTRLKTLSPFENSRSKLNHKKVPELFKAYPRYHPHANLIWPDGPSQKLKLRGGRFREISDTPIFTMFWRHYTVFGISAAACVTAVAYVIAVPAVASINAVADVPLVPDVLTVPCIPALARVTGVFDVSCKAGQS